MRYGRTVARAATLGVLGLLLVACSDDERDNGRRPTTTVSSTTSTTLDPESAVRAAYRASWVAYIRLGTQAAPFDPKDFKATLGPYVTGDQYDRLFNDLQLLTLKGEILQGSPEAIENKVRVASLGSTTATLRDCYDDELQGYKIARRYKVDDTYKVDLGSRLDTDDPARHLIEVVMVIEDGRWKVSKVTPIALPGGQRCTEP